MRESSSAVHLRQGSVRAHFSDLQGTGSEPGGRPVGLARSASATRRPSLTIPRELKRLSCGEPVAPSTMHHRVLHETE